MITIVIPWSYIMSKAHEVGELRKAGKEGEAEEITNHLEKLIARADQIVLPPEPLHSSAYVRT